MNIWKKKYIKYNKKYLDLIKLIGGNNSYEPSLKGWYPNNYQKIIQEQIKNKKKTSNVKAVIVPHAGFDYSSSVAIDVYSTIDFHNYNKILLLCTNHKNNGFLLPPFDKISIFNLSINQIWKDKLKSNGFKIGLLKEFQDEHSFEMQLIYIATLAEPNTSILPILVGDDITENIAEKIFTLIDDKTLIIVTSDFTHYGNKFKYIKPNENTDSIKEFIKKKRLFGY